MSLSFKIALFLFLDYLKKEINKYLHKVTTDNAYLYLSIYPKIWNTILGLIDKVFNSKFRLNEEEDSLVK